MKGLLASFCFIAGAVLCVTPSAAQTVHITLQEKNGSGTITGKLISFSDTSYRIVTNAGPISVTADNVDCIGRACPVHKPLDLPEIASSMKRIELSALDGKIRIHGELKGYYDEQYVVDVPSLGMVRLQRAGLRCSGPGCRVRELLALTAPAAQQAGEPEEPPVEEVVQDITAPPRVMPIIGERELTEGLLAPLLTRFAAEFGTGEPVSQLSRSSYSIAFDAAGDGAFVGGTGMDAAFGAFTSGAADFAVTSRQLSDADVQAMATLGVPDLRNTEHETVIAVDGLSVALHPQSPLEMLEYAQVAAIYSGAIVNWAELGGPDAPIVVVHREFGSTPRATFSKAMFDGADAPLLRGSLIANSTEEMIAILTNEPRAIGYLSGSATEAVRDVTLTGACGLMSTPTPFSRMAEDGLMPQRMYLYSHPDLLTETGRAFRRFVRTSQAADTLAQTPFAGFDVLRVPLASSRPLVDLNALENSAQRALSRQLASELKKWDRLSTTVRFAEGASQLGQKEQDDIARLVTHLETLPADSELAIVGFADSSGDFGINLRLARQRAELVERALNRAGGSGLTQLKISSRAYGELAPILCNTDANGRAVNRRVEIWIRSNTL